MIQYGKQVICEDDIESVTSVLRSDFLTQGPAVPLFEENFKRFVGANEAVAVNSATSALHLACIALGVTAGDLVWTSPISFVASANCARYCGANIDFVDIDQSTINIDINALTIKLENASRFGKLPKVLIAVHMTGLSADMHAISELARKYHFSVIEDASHAVGATYRNTKVGSCTYSDITVFSFHPVKIITTGEGGIATTNCPNLAANMRRNRSHGITRDKADFSRGTTSPWHYEQVSLGYNYRMTDIAAALGNSQLRKIGHLIAKRKTLVHEYNGLLRNLGIELPGQTVADGSSWHLYIIKLPGGSSCERDQLFKKLTRDGIGVNVHYEPIHLQPYYRHLGFREGQFAQAENYSSRCLTLPLHPSLDSESIDYVSNRLWSHLS